MLKNMYGFDHFLENIKKHLLDTGLDSLKTASKKVVYKAAQPNPNNSDGILKNATISVPLKYLSNFQRSLVKPLISCKVEVKNKETKYCALFVAGNDNTNANPSNITVTIKDTKLNVPVVTVSARDSQKLSNSLAKDWRDWFIGMNI